MRRISVFILVMMVVIILSAEAAGISLNPAVEKRAEIYAKAGSAVIEGRIAEAAPGDSGGFRLVIDSREAGRVLVKVKGETEEDIYSLPGRWASAEIEAALPESASNPGCFDYRKYLRSEGIFLTGKCSEEQLKTGKIVGNFFKGLLINKVSIVKHRFYIKMSRALAGLEDLLPGKGAGDEPAGFGAEAAGLFSGMLFGDRSGLSEETYESFRENGTAHVLSVSGLHVGIIYGAVGVLMGKRRRSCAAACLRVFTLAGCALLASFSVSVMRAVFMAVLHLLAERIHKRYDMISAACVTASVFLLKNPYMLFSPGFILSFSAVLSLAVIGGGLKRRIKSENPVFSAAVPLAAVQLGTAPVNVIMFNYFSFASFTANIPVIFLSGIMIPAGAAAFLLSCAGRWAEPIFDTAAVCCGFLGEMLLFFNDFTGMGGKLGFAAGTPGVFAAAAFYLILLAVFSEYSFLNPMTSKRFAALVIMCAVLFSLSAAEWQRTPEIVFLDVGQGDCIHIKTPEGRNYVVDGGGSLFSDYDVGEEVILPYLRSAGIGKLDGIFISHMDADHYKGTASLSKMIDTGNVFLYEGYRASESEAAARLGKAPEDFVYLKKGDVVQLGRGVSAEVVFPENTEEISLEKSSDGKKNGGEENNLNELCMVVMLNYSGTEILLTGDIGAEEEKSLGKEIACDIVKVPHHGSGYSSSEDFVSRTEASAAVIQVGKNNFGHPAESVIERYDKKGIMLFRNDEDGAVLVDIKRDGYVITGYKSGEKYEFQRICQ
ncbi:MAG: DNA internalization-related competence protein ComEC/Rec2 [Bacillota bacterium]|nr:DNA internalization-related competence protein ComEC/Rec2 [Bacillota bacterium]